MKGCEAPWTLWTLKWFQVARMTSFGVKNRFLGSGGRRQGKGYSRNKRGILDGGLVVCEGGCRERRLSGCPVHQENQGLWQNKSKLIFLGLVSSGQTIWSSLELSLFPLGGFFSYYNVLYRFSFFALYFKSIYRCIRRLIVIPFLVNFNYYCNL